VNSRVKEVEPMERQQAFSRTIPREDKRHAGRTSTSATPLALRTHHVELERWLGSYVRERAGRKLGKHAHQIQRVTVRFDDVNGPKKGVDILCRIKIQLPRLTSVIVEERGTDPREAFDKALDAADGALLRTLERHARHGSRNRAPRPWAREATRGAVRE
jgi:ribosome-associated translation inhibitor RaiA